MTDLRIKYQFIFWIAIWIFPILVQVWGQNPNPNAATSSSCGGVLELSSGVLEFSPVGQNRQDFCMWVIKLPVTSQNIRFQLTQIPPSSQLNLYSQKGQVAGQFSILPIATLTSADVLNGTINVNESNLIAIWTPSRGQVEKEDDGAILSFKWDSVKGERENQGLDSDSDLVGGVNYVEADRGRFSWVKPGEIQQSLLWVLNSGSTAIDSNSLDLKIETEFEKCDLIDPCLCSYFGVYEIYDNFLRVVSTECGRSSNVQVSGIRRRLVGLGFVNPEFRRDTNHVTLTWNGEQPEEGTTTQTTSTTTEKPKTCKKLYKQLHLGSSASGFPKSCSEMQFESGSNSSQLQNCVIYPFGNFSSLEVLCDFETDGGGWTIIQKRSSGPKEEFDRNWADYANGFGSLGQNFWLGLENIHALTKNGDQELRIELEDFEGEQAYAKYTSFSVSDASDFYRLSINGYSGDAGNDMMNSADGGVHNGMQFTTKDKDNDGYAGGNCAVPYPGGWWFNACFNANLNGLYREKGETAANSQGILWFSWKGSYSLAKTEMKIRKRK